ncbi:MAG: cell envelope integrity protein TolA [Bacteroidota bacterium]|nr:cell envelope integrity protein TolA [Bacteroidota bacterium]
MSKQLLSTILFTLFFIFTANAQEISSNQQEKFRDDAKNSAITYFNILQLVGMQDYSTNEELELYKQEIFKWFEDGKSQVHNNLSGTDPTLSIRQYLSDVQSIFPKNGIIFTQDVKHVSNVYYHQQENYYFVKLQANVGVNGINTKNNPVQSKDDLDFIIKIRKAPYKVQISDILPHKDDLMKRDNDGNRLFVPVTITTQDNDEFADFEEFQRMVQAAKKRQAELDQREERIRENERLINKRFREIKEKEQELKRKEQAQKEENERLERERLEQLKEKRRQKQKEDNLRREAKKQKAKDDSLKKAAEAQRKRELLASHKRFFVNIGGGAYYQTGTFENIVNNQSLTVNNSISYQINAALGFRFDFHRNMTKIRRGSLLGIFGRYGINNSDIVNMNITNHDLLIPEDKRDPVFNSYLEAEAGLIFREVFRLSAGMGKMYKYTYNTTTAALYLNFSPFVLEVATTAMFGRDFRGMQFRPSAALYFQFNDGKLKKLPKNNAGSLFFGIGYNHPYMIVSNSLSQGFNADYFSKQITGELGINLGRKHKIGVFANYGLMTNLNAEKIINEYKTTVNLDPADKYNPHREIQGGFIFWNKWKISYGIGDMRRPAENPIDYHVATMGFHLPIWIFKLKLDVSTLFIDQNYSKPIYRISPGLLLNINFAK